MNLFDYDWEEEDKNEWHRQLAMGRKVKTSFERVPFYKVDIHNNLSKYWVKIPTDKNFTIIDLDYEHVYDVDPPAVLIKLKDEQGEFYPWFPLGYFSFVDHLESYQ